jgi:CspA family cold shock protein
MRASPPAVAGARVEPAAVVARAETIATTVHEQGLGADSTRAVGRRMQHGIVKWFSSAKGYGFIKADDGTEAFVHHSAISSAGVRTLSEGQPVSYDEVASPKGLSAVNVFPTVLGTGPARR